MNLTAIDDDGDTVLHVAARYWVGGGSQLDTAAAELLRTVPPAFVNKANKDGETPLHIAAFYGSRLLAKHLLTAPSVDVK